MQLKSIKQKKNFQRHKSYIHQSDQWRNCTRTLEYLCFIQWSECPHNPGTRFLAGAYCRYHSFSGSDYRGGLCAF